MYSIYLKTISIIAETMGKKSRFVGSYANLSVENGGCTEAHVETSWAVLVVLCNQLCVSLSS